MKQVVLFLMIALTLSSCKQDKVAYNNLNDALISNEQAEIIFQKIKGFPNSTQVAIAFIENGQAKFFGAHRVNDTISPVGNHRQVFEIGSLSKLFTSTILANFVLEEKLLLDDNINSFLAFPINGDSKISFKQLANHTSGLPKMPTNLKGGDRQNKFVNYDNKKIEEYLHKYLELSASPGQSHSYSNIGAGILGYTLCQISNSNYEQLLDKYIISRWAMSHTSTSHDAMKAYLVKGINSKGTEAPNSILASLTPAGGVLSSVEDMAKFAQAQFDPANRDLELTRRKTFQMNDSSAQGLGWRIEQKPTGQLYCHNGKTKGFSSSIALNVEKKKGVIILANVATFRKGNTKTIEELCLQLLYSIQK